jgi:hypothetical protein
VIFSSRKAGGPYLSFIKLNGSGSERCNSFEGLLPVSIIRQCSQRKEKQISASISDVSEGMKLSKANNMSPSSPAEDDPGCHPSSERGVVLPIAD